MTTKRRGRPPVGERVSVRLPADVLARLDDEAALRRESRAAVIRRALTEYATRDSGVDREQIRRMLRMTPAERVRTTADAANKLLALQEAFRRT